MTRRIASLPMYDADPAAVDAWWQAIGVALRASGLDDVPAALDWPADLAAHWRDPQLLLSQTCGLPLVTTLRDQVQVVGAMRYTAPGCSGIRYRSELVAREDDDARAIEGFRGRIAVVNAHDSHSGSNALRALVAPLAGGGRFFGGWRVSGSHRASLAAVRSSTADIAAIDCMTLAGLRRRDPQSLAGLRIVGTTEAAPGLPLITSAATTPDQLARLRAALQAACNDPASADVREALFIGGFEVASAATWDVIDSIRARSSMS